MNKAILVTIDFDNNLVDYQEKELKNLAASNDIETVFFVRQKLKTPKMGYYVGKGKLDEIKMAIDTFDADIVIFNDELTPSQIRNIESYLDISVIDRSMLILNIFAARAKTTESMIEVELAQLRYMLPRLTGLSKSLSRQGGGFNAKGPGEKQIELDRRKIEKRIYKLNDDLKKIIVERKNRRQKRDIKMVALVGYTNAGKSSLMNTLLNRFSVEKKTVFEADMLFATLTTSTRKITLSNNQSFALTDTVGFVSNLPHHLINSFKSTLEEIVDADLLLHVIDASNPFYPEQIATTNQVLKDLKADNIQCIYVYNKADLLSEQFFPHEENSLLVSTKDGQNISLLINHIKDCILNETTLITLLIPYEKGALLHDLEEFENIHKKEYLEKGTQVTVTINNRNLKKYLSYQISSAK